MKSCLILDYGVGNIESIQSFFKEQGYQVSFGNSAEQIANTKLLILPGVGSFKEAARNVELNGLKSSVVDRHIAKKPILGICLGLQLLGDGSDESPNSLGFGILSGQSQRLYDYSRIGWDTLHSNVTNPLSHEFFYFNHSYAAYTLRGNRFNMESTTGRYKALVVEDNSIGVQFHPEKSQSAGRKFLDWAEQMVWALND
jgi:glutamine amidotransferase